ncbi:unnamed protein product [Notodromas monacha]|uniref:Protein kinase domain-containing protein n=1 Tax=Notodromas monacha TaxID=399045 RepID=A0A7R9G986_9CRUS|nr:unnamed protein product [Notodromas monacha]CAG0913972.1 unnamed protein product [Notodromas monacha]
MSSKAKDEPKLPADGIIRDVATGKSYRRGKFLGKGGFARVYELTCVASNQTFAGKIVPKTLLQKLHQREKMKQEIAIHKSLNHKHVLKFHCNFEDAENVYIVLEVCRKRTLMELHRRRKTVTEPEARYFMHQMCDALKYLHESRVVHRDLKLGNLLLNDDLELKIADFGLATLIEKNGDRKMQVDYFGLNTSTIL